MPTDPPGGRPSIPDAIVGPRVVAIGRGLDARRLVEVAEALRRGGVRAFELTLDSRDAVGGITTLTSRYGADDLLVGAGTVLTIEDAKRAVDAGACFLVSPHLDASLVDWAASRGLAAFPGAFSPTEILEAWRAGAAAVKLFPASVLGPAFVREHRGPFRDIPLIPTGGVTLETAPAFVAAGAVAVGLGSWLTGIGDAATIEERARRLIGALIDAGRR
jgi:2-dehydro-3-deoxyphosphogluconate aldolase/(4S)-4-hydroxy-2-oxoglutarate aldolase